MMQAVLSGFPEIAAAYIVVAPDGPSNSWNIKGEESNEDDAAYIGNTLLNYLATFSNVDPSFTLYGFSAAVGHSIA